MRFSLEDEPLIALYQNSDREQEEIYNEIINRYYAFVLKGCRATLYKNSTARLIYEGLDDLARDIAHDFFVEQMPRVLQKYDTSRGTFRTWLARCVANFAIDALRRRPKGEISSFQIEDEEWKSHQLLNEVLGEESPFLSHDRRDLRDILMNHLNALPDHYRKPIQLRFWGEMSVEEVAKELRLPVGTVKSQLSRAITLLRQRLQAEGLDRELR
ncbi:MAG: sigma-70 family RNA polymerase sigma factor [Bacteroidia bacterium]|nr:sigma-70 family RNA polymerase sigma factor [Bacteroidia bacterium]